MTQTLPSSLLITGRLACPWSIQLSCSPGPEALNWSLCTTAYKEALMSVSWPRSHFPDLDCHIWAGFSECVQILSLVGMRELSEHVEFSTAQARKWDALGRSLKCWLFCKKKKNTLLFNIQTRIWCSLIKFTLFLTPLILSLPLHHFSLSTSCVLSL